MRPTKHYAVTLRENPEADLEAQRYHVEAQAFEMQELPKHPVMIAGLLDSIADTLETNVDMLAHGTDVALNYQDAHKQLVKLKEVVDQLRGNK